MRGSLPWLSRSGSEQHWSLAAGPRLVVEPISGRRRAAIACASHGQRLELAECAAHQRLRLGWERHLAKHHRALRSTPPVAVRNRLGLTRHCAPALDPHTVTGTTHHHPAAAGQAHLCMHACMHVCMQMHAMHAHTCTYMHMQQSGRRTASAGTTGRASVALQSYGTVRRSQVVASFAQLVASLPACCLPLSTISSAPAHAACLAEWSSSSRAVHPSSNERASCGMGAPRRPWMATRQLSSDASESTRI